MPTARKHLVCVAATPYYHVLSRCVRRAFLCGVDHASNKSYEHRRDWIEDQLALLCSVFSISVCAYAIMSNHYHLVVRLNPSQARDWSDDEVLKRWTTLFRGTILVQRHLAGEALSVEESKTVRETAGAYRSRLASLSWFMKCLNEPIARKANAEDDCTGHFWESRFKSHALLTEHALIAAMVYVDLNPVRAGIANRPETARFTSIRTRLQNAACRAAGMSSAALLPFMDERPRQQSSTRLAIPIQKRDYLELINTTGQVATSRMAGQASASLAPILNRLGIDEEAWPIEKGSLQGYLRLQFDNRIAVA